MTNAGGPYELPEGWEWTTLGDIVADVGKVNPKNDNPEKEFVYLDIASIDNSEQKITNPKMYLGGDAPSRARQLVKSGDILFSTVRTYLKNIAMVNEMYDGQIASTGFCVIRPYDSIDKRLVFQLVQMYDFLEPLNQIQRGTSYPAVRDSDVFAQMVPLPPLPEQRRIVAKIEELFTQLDAGVSALETARAHLKRYRQSVLKAAVEGKLTEEWRAAHPDAEPASVLLEQIEKEREKNAKGRRKKLPPLDVSELPELPEGWEWARLPQLGELNRGKSKHRPRNDPKLYGGPYPFVQTGDIRHTTGILHNYSQTYNEEGLKQSQIWPKGTLCITIAANIADTAILGFDACFPDSIVGFLAENNHCSIQFVEYFIRTAKENIERYAPATAQKNINLKILGDIAVSFPSLAEQHEIVSEIERRLIVADKTAATIAANLKRAARLRQSILKKAFRGQLVPQDPNDEPASVLLERIRAERAKAPPKGRKARPRKKRATRATKQTELVS